MSKRGILKLKSKYEEKSVNLINLQVFAYSSKLFRDDSKALELDRENHLIPAPYDPNLMISRYDVRTTILSDIAQYEATSDTFNRLDGLSDAEKQAEILAEEERYFSLYRNEVEEEMYKEEQLKREATASASAYNQVAFSYDQPPQEEQPIGPTVQPSEIENDDDTPFIANEKLNLPPDMELPPSEKLNQIIEKTAKFIASQGAQMEILLKTKQSSNPQFNFLNHDGQYNAYYKHILVMMKNNTYPWQEVTPSETKNEENSKSCENGNGENGTLSSSAIFIPKIQYKPSADCAYTQLISKITKAPISELERKREEENAEGNDKKKKIEALGLLQSYNSSDDSDASENEDEKDFSSIPPEIQVTIDKTALYVAKNGPEFEEKLKVKQSETFKFLNTDNEHHAYYKMKVKQNQTALNIPSEQPATVAKSKEESIKVKTPPPPVCFSIKSKEDKQPLTKSTIAHNSDDEQNQQRIKVNDIILPQAPSPPKISASAEVEEELERQVDIVNAEREEKLAKARLNDKLLISARERLGLLPKEKMLQIERKKRAMMFMMNKNIKGSSNGNSSHNDGEIVNLVQCEEDSNDSSLKSSPKVSSKHSSRSRSRRKSSTSRSSSSSSSSSRSSDSSPRRKRSKKHRKRKHRKASRSRSRERSRYRSRSRSKSRNKKHSSRRRR